MNEKELHVKIEQFIFDYTAEYGIVLNAFEQKFITNEMLNDMVGLGPIEGICKHPKINEVMVNAFDKIYYEFSGKIFLSKIKFRSDAHLMQIAQRMVNQIGRRIDASSPLCDARLQDGSRVNIVIPPIALSGTTITIRKFVKINLAFDDLLDRNSASSEMIEFLKIAAKMKLNVLVSGGTGSGKTTLLNLLSELIPDDERIITCEDSAELDLSQSHTIRLESRPKNIEGVGEISIRDLVKNALRMRPDRIIVGEVRGEEVIDMMQAMNTGHDGSMSTIHANGAKDALLRIENMVLISGINIASSIVRKQIASAIDIIIHTARLSDGIRKIVEIIEVSGINAKGEIMVKNIFKFQANGIDDDGRVEGEFEKFVIQPKFIEKAKMSGLSKKLSSIIGFESDD